MPKLAAVVCDSLFATIDVIEKQKRKKQQKQGNISLATPLIASPPTHKKIRPTLNINTNTNTSTNTNTTHKQPKDRQVPVISNNNTSKKKKKQKKAIPTKTTREIQQPTVTVLNKNQVIPTIIEDESNHNEFTASNNNYYNIDNKILRTE